jgi:hypothetical protein
MDACLYRPPKGLGDVRAGANLIAVAPETLYKELGRAIAGAIEADRGRTEYTFDDRETIDRDCTTVPRQTSLMAPASRLGDPGRTDYTATVETIDRDQHACQQASALFDQDLYVALASEAAGEADRGRTETTKAVETIDVDRHAQRRASALFRRSRDLYGALASPVAAGPDRGRTEVTEATETIDFDRPPGGLGR